MIKRLRVEGLNEKINFDLIFHEDMNILTGKNGSGKTTTLKLAWYLISGNIERIFPEIKFNSVFIETDNFSLNISKIEKAYNKSRRLNNTYSIEFITSDNAPFHKEISSDNISKNPVIDLINKRIATTHGGSSVFFPTFRRIEGGFSLRSGSSHLDWRYQAAPSLEDSMRILSDSISVFNHKFVSSISTQDIVQLLTSRYADISEQTNSLHSELSTDIIDRISNYSRERNTLESEDQADSVLQAIAYQVDEVTAKRNELLKPFSVLSDLITNIFQYKGIRITEGVTLGDTANAISSDKLSAGEKQLLSFLCYNAFFRSSAFFIDEPELSLHTDWQRILFPTLLQQATGNQFIIATHSPFIYSKYPDKELVLDQDRGGE